MILSFKLLLTSLVCGAVYLLIIGFIWSFVEKFIPTFENFPKHLIEEKSGGWIFYNLFIEFIFFVFMPTVVYHWLYALLPVSGIRGGVAVGLFLFIMGIVPYSILILFRIKLPVVYLLYQTVGLMLKVVGALAIIGYLYSL